MGKIVSKNLVEVHKRSGRLNKVKPISVQKSALQPDKIVIAPENDDTESENDSQQATDILIKPNKEIIKV